MYNSMQVDQCVRSCSSINNKIISFKKLLHHSQLGDPQKEKKIRGPWARAQCAHLLRRLWAGHRRRVPAAAGALSSKCGGVMLMVERRDSIHTCYCCVYSYVTQSSKVTTVARKCQPSPSSVHVRHSISVLCSDSKTTV